MTMKITGIYYSPHGGPVGHKTPAVLIVVREKDKDGKHTDFEYYELMDTEDGGDAPADVYDYIGHALAELKKWNST